MIEIRWTAKKTGLVLQYRTWAVRVLEMGMQEEAGSMCARGTWTEWTDVVDVNGDTPRIWDFNPLPTPYTDIPK